jgi:hypothetical protein
VNGIFSGETKDGVIMNVKLSSDETLFLIDGSKSLTVNNITFKLEYYSSNIFLIDFSSNNLIKLESITIIPKNINDNNSYGGTLIYLRNGRYELIDIKIESIFILFYFYFFYFLFFVI